MSVNRFAQVIEGPANMAGIELEPGLVQGMVQDTKVDDALPCWHSHCASSGHTMAILDGWRSQPIAMTSEA